jgi:hypothetical protein
MVEQKAESRMQKPESRIQNEQAGIPNAQSGRATADENEPMLYCPVCSTRLAEMKCKLICNQCGYYMSCADYY